MKLAPFLLAPLLACAGCSRFAPTPYSGPSAEGDARAFAGCYQAVYANKDEPWHFFLDSIRPAKRGKPGAWRAHASRMPTMQVSYWRFTPGGLQLYVSNMLDAAYLDFEVRGDSLVGRDFFTTDIHFRGPPANRLVTAHRVPCPPGNWDPAAPRDSARR